MWPGKLRVFLAIASVSLAFGCQSTPERLPQLQVPPDAFRSAVQGICVGEVGSQVELGERGAERLARLEEIVSGALVNAGYRVVPTPAATELWQRVVRAGDALYDPDFGERRPDAYEAAHEAYYDALSAEHGCDTLLDVQLAVVTSYWMNGTAAWDGVQDSFVSWTGAFWTGRTAWGRVPALSVWISLRNRERDDLYFGAGGVEVISRLESAFSAEFVPDAPEELLQDDARLRNAIWIALREVPGIPRVTRRGIPRRRRGGEPPRSAPPRRSSARSAARRPGCDRGGVRGCEPRLRSRFRMRLAAVAAGLAFALAFAAAPARGADRLVVAWDATGGGGKVQAFGAAAPWGPETPALAVDADGVVHTAFGRVYHLSRASGVLRVIDPASWQVVQSFALGAATQPRDVAVVGPRTAWVSRQAQTQLLRLDLETGATALPVDLAPFADADGLPEVERLLAAEGRLYVQLRRESNGPAPFEAPAMIAVVDLASETLVDADPVLPGVQAIALAGSSPRFAMQLVPSTRRLYVSATGFWQDAGGLEEIDVDALASTGLIVDEGSDDVGSDLGAFVLSEPDAGWLSYSTDIVLSSHLHAFSVAGGVHPFEVHNALLYFTPALVHDAASDALFWPEPGGFHVFDAATGGQLTGALVPVDGEPTDLALLSLPGVPALPAPALAALAGLLAALPLAAARRALRIRRDSAPRHRGR